MLISEGVATIARKAIRLRLDLLAVAFNNRKGTCSACAKRNGDNIGALRDYDQMVHLSPDNPIGIANRGTARFKNGDIDGALQDYDKAISFQPDTPGIFFARVYYDRSQARRKSRRSLMESAEGPRRLRSGLGLQVPASSSLSHNRAWLSKNH